MKVVVQRSKHSQVMVDSKITGEIDFGLVLLVSFNNEDEEQKILPVINKIVNLRIFDDCNGVMNKSLLEVGGQALSISQFTLYADIKKGRRPSYQNAKNHAEALELYNKFNQTLEKFVPVQTGIFGSEMLLTIENDGPVTIIIESEDLHD